MTAPAPRRRTPAENLRRFLRTPKGTVLWVLLALAALAMVHTQRHTLPTVAAGVLAAAAVDLVLTAVRRTKLTFPSGAVITGLIVAMVLARTTPLYAVGFAAALGVAVKHGLRTRWSNIFNPATAGLLLGALVFHSGQSWWGALPYYPFLGFVLVLAAGLYIAQKVNKLALALSYLGVLLAVCMAAAFAGDAASVAQVFRAPDVNALIFFACLMLTDPPSSPARPRDQIWFGAAAGVLGSAIFLAFGVQWFILAGLPVANLVESWRRVVARPASAARRDPAGPSSPASGPPRAPQRPQAAPSRGEPSRRNAPPPRWQAPRGQKSAFLPAPRRRSGQA